MAKPGYSSGLVYISGEPQVAGSNPARGSIQARALNGAVMATGQAYGRMREDFKDEKRQRKKTYELAEFSSKNLLMDTELSFVKTFRKN